MEQAIKQAIKGGYSRSEFKQNEDWDRILLDPSWWLALGKAEGWNNKTIDMYSEIQEYYDESHRDDCMTIASETKLEIHHWHAFIDHLADGGNIDDFFNSILKK